MYRRRARSGGAALFADAFGETSQLSQIKGEALQDFVLRRATPATSPSGPATLAAMSTGREPFGSTARREAQETALGRASYYLRGSNMDGHGVGNDNMYPLVAQMGTHGFYISTKALCAGALVIILLLLVTALDRRRR